MNGRTIHLLGIAGSLREGSYNRGLLRAARELLPPRADLQVYDALGEIPPYNEDVRLAGEPDVVRDLKARVREADGLIFATPEYNYSVPGVLKNAIDWVARPPDESPLRKKHAVIMGATPGNFGTVRAQVALRQILVYTDTYALLQPEFLLFKAEERFDSQGNLTDPTSRELMRTLLREFVNWIRTFPAESEPARELRRVG